MPSLLINPDSEHTATVKVGYDSAVSILKVDTDYAALALATLEPSVFRTLLQRTMRPGYSCDSVLQWYNAKASGSVE